MYLFRKKVKEAFNRVNEHLSEQNKCPEGSRIDFLVYHKNLECQFRCFSGKKCKATLHRISNHEQLWIEWLTKRGYLCLIWLRLDGVESNERYRYTWVVIKKSKNLLWLSPWKSNTDKQKLMSSQRFSLWTKKEAQNSRTLRALMGTNSLKKWLLSQKRTLPKTSSYFEENLLCRKTHQSHFIQNQEAFFSLRLKPLLNG